MSISVGIVDDHQLLLKSFSLLLTSFPNFSVAFEAVNGNDLQEKIKLAKKLPAIILLDASMPLMDGSETAHWLTVHYSQIKLVAMSMTDDDKTVIEMIRAGCCAFLLKQSSPAELEEALIQVNKTGYYNGDKHNVNFRKLINGDHYNEPVHIHEHEHTFLHLACSNLTYQSIVEEMGLSEAIIDTYRESLFTKFKVGSRTGLALEAKRRNLLKW